MLQSLFAFICAARGFILSNLHDWTSEVLYRKLIPLLKPYILTWLSYVVKVLQSMLSLA